MTLWEGNLDNLLKVYSIAYEEEVEAGQDWYTKANQWAQDVAYAEELPVSVVIDTLAQLSPNNQWERNKSDTIMTIRSWKEGVTDPKLIPCCTFNSNVWRALEILNGNQVGPIGPKVSAFAHNIKYPETVWDHVVTVDIWAWRAWVWNSRKQERITFEISSACATDYVEAAGIVGHVPRDFQAIVWLTVRRAGGYGRAKYCGLDRLYNQPRLF